MKNIIIFPFLLISNMAEYRYKEYKAEIEKTGS
jgi:hypothetical protein